MPSRSKVAKSQAETSLRFAYCYRCGISGTRCYDAGTRTGRLGCGDSSGRCVLSGGACGVGFYQKNIVNRATLAAGPRKVIRVTGSVVDEAGKGMPEKRVKVFLPNGTVVGMETDAQGRFAIEIGDIESSKTAPEIVQLGEARIEKGSKADFVPVFAYLS